jgi:hypothetical protein
MVRVRKDVEKLNAVERKIFLNALRTLYLRPPNDVRSFQSFVRTHRLATLGLPAQYPDQAHHGPAFLAWHRAFLLEFERELQKIDARVALPYWRIWNPQPTMPKLFAGDFLGSISPPGTPPKDTDGLELVKFDDDNPLNGWTAPYCVYGGKPTATPTKVFRYKVDWKTPPDTIAAPDQIEQQIKIQKSFHGFASEDVGGIEDNPHDIGHAELGPWMLNCRISPSDPAFWLFHNELDRLWARWQYVHDTFGNDGKDSNDYYFVAGGSKRDASRGHFDSNRGKDCDATLGWDCPAFGHNLFDTMWPWDGITGDLGAKMKSRRPPTAEFGAFPQSTVSGLWPAYPAKPRPADMIDYAGVTDRRVDLGFGYDDVPFGRRSPGGAATPPVPPLAAIPDRDELMRIVTARDRPDDQRLEALDVLEVSRDDTLLPLLRRLVEERPERPELARRALGKLGLLMFIHDGFTAANHHEIMSIADAALTGSEPYNRVLAVRRMLEGGDDAKAIAVLRDALTNRSQAKISPVAAILILGQVCDGQQAAIIRPSLDPKYPEKERLAAVQVLAGDRDSQPLLKEILDNEIKFPALRAAALDSLLLNYPALPERAAKLAENQQEDKELRRHALAAIGAYVMANRTQLTDKDLTAIKERVATLVSAGLPPSITNQVLSNVETTIDAALARR